MSMQLLPKEGLNCMRSSFQGVLRRYDIRTNALKVIDACSDTLCCPDVRKTDRGGSRSLQLSPSSLHIAGTPVAEILPSC